MRDEEPRLRSLIEAADAIAVDTKLSRLMTVVEERFKDRSVLFFTGTRPRKQLWSACCSESTARAA